MKTTTRRTAILLTATALGLGGAAAAAPALAATVAQHGPIATASSGPGWQHGGMGMGNGRAAGDGGALGGGGGMGNRMGAGTVTGDGTCAGIAVTAPQGTLSDAQKKTLVALAQEEKLAQDLYGAFADSYPAVVFDHVAVAEFQHLTAVRTLLQRYGVADPTAGKPAGQFSDPAVQATYDKLLAQGRTGQDAALGVARQVERTDIADLTAALRGLSAPDATQVYTHLVTASRQHLAMFTRWAGR